MKKLVLVIVCALVMTVFIAFNYLLWDREDQIRNYEYLSYSKKASVDALSEDIQELSDVNDQLKKKISELENNNRILQDKYQQIVQDKNAVEGDLEYKKVIIDKLLRQTNLKVFEDIIRKWMDNINQALYEEAYSMMAPPTGVLMEPIGLQEFTNDYKTAVESIKFVSMELDPSEIAGDIAFKVTLEAKTLEHEGKSLYDEGLNEILFTLQYNKEKDCWMISEIANKKV